MNGEIVPPVIGVVLHSSNNRIYGIFCCVMVEVRPQFKQTDCMNLKYKIVSITKQKILLLQNASTIWYSQLISSFIQNEILRIITGALRYLSNDQLRHDLNVETV